MDDLDLKSAEEYTQGDETALVRFFTDCGYSPTPRFWKWMNRDCPDGMAQYVYSCLPGAIVSHYSYMPRTLQFRGGLIKAGLGIHLASHPAHRSLEALLNVLNLVTEKATGAGVKVLFGFPNNNSFRILNRMQRWRLFDDIPALEADTGLLSARLPESRGVSLVNSFSDEHAGLLRAFVPDNCSAVAKSAAYLTWRYLDNPVNKYFAVSSQNGAAFAVLKVYQKEAVKFGHLLDIGCDKNKADSFNALLADALVLFRRERVDRVSFWLSPRHPRYGHALGLGFEPCGFKTHFGCRALDAGYGHLEKTDWHISMGDSDAF